jgi:DNA-binding transcriptional regulator YiaG
MPVAALLRPFDSLKSEEGKAWELLPASTSKDCLPGDMRAYVHYMRVSHMLAETEASIPVGKSIIVNLKRGVSLAATVTWKGDRLFEARFVGNAAIERLRASEFRAVLRSDARLSEYAESFGNRLRRLRTKLGLTQGELSARLGVSIPSISGWESDTARPKTERREALATILGVSVHDLLGLDELESVQEVVNRCRVEIASAAGTRPDSVRVSIDM